MYILFMEQKVINSSYLLKLCFKELTIIIITFNVKNKIYITCELHKHSFIVIQLIVNYNARTFISSVYFLVNISCLCLLLHIASFCLPSDILRFALILSTPWMDIMQLLINCIVIKNYNSIFIGCFLLDGLICMLQ